MERVELYEKEQLISDDEHLEQRNFSRKSSSFNPAEGSDISDDKIREIFVPITNVDDTKILRYACELARAFSARITLLYNVPLFNLSESMLEYSRIEGYGDFYSDHIQSSGEAALAKISVRLQKEGVEFRKVITCSDEKKILGELLKGPNTEAVAVVLSAGRKNTGFAKLGILKGLAATMILESKVPVFVIP
jgi:nucleotide-binding universal stress UspA family protein